MVDRTSVARAEDVGSGSTARSSRSILLFWAPLALQWVMMAVEGPFLAAVIARMGEPAHNLAAHGVAFAFAILLESPVIMLMSASTALVEDAESYRRLRNFSAALNIGATALVLVVLIPPVFNALAAGVLGLPDPVVGLVYGALWLLLPWPGAIGHRRFLHGLLIRAGRTRLIAYGTLLRLGAMAATAMALYTLSSLPGAWVGALALSAGVVVEAAAARMMAAGVIARLTAGAARPAVPPPEPPGPPEAESGAEAGSGGEEVAGAEAAARTLVDRGESALRRTGAAARALRRRVAASGYGEIARFYFPLALTSLIGLTVQPMLTFFMGRAVLPIESLAVFPVVHALSFLFRAPGLAFQEVVIALSGKRLENIVPLRRFGVGLGLALSGLLALVTFTPLADLWFKDVSGLPESLATLAIWPTRISVPLAALTVLLAFQQGVLVQARRTRQITAASVFEVIGIAVLFTLLGWQFDVFGASAAMLGLVGGRVLANGYLWTRVRKVLPMDQPSPSSPTTL